MSKRYSKAQVNVLKKRETEYWIYSYSDLITNLLALFIMMLIIKSGSNEKQEKFKKGLEAYTSGTKVTNATGEPGLNSLDDMRQIITQYLAENHLDKRVSLYQVKDGISLSFEGGLLFSLGTADVQGEALPVLKQTASLIKKLPSKFIIEVEGHADNKPITSGTFPSNWELSSARAGSVVRVLMNEGLGPKRMRAIGYSDTQPIDKDGSSPLNRRVVIKINSADSGGNKL